MTDGQGKGGTFENDVAYLVSDWAAPRSGGRSWSELQVAHLPFRRRSTESHLQATDWVGQRDLLHRPDVEFPFCIECKKVEGWTFDAMLTNPNWLVWQWWQQALDQAAVHTPLIPLLVFSRNRQPMFAMLPEGAYVCPPYQPAVPRAVVTPPTGNPPVVVMRFDDLIRTPLRQFLDLPASTAGGIACPPKSSKTSSSKILGSRGMKQRLYGGE